MKYVLKTFSPLFYALILFVCTSCSEPEVQIILSADKSLNSISTEINGKTYEGQIDETSKTVTLTLPYYFRFVRETLSFSYQIRGNSIAPNLNDVADYTNPQKVTVTADNGTSVEYTIKVELLPEYELELTLDNLIYSQSDSVRVKGKNLGQGTGITLITLNDLNTFNPFTGSFDITLNILSSDVRMNDTELVIPLSTLTMSKYDIAIKFPDRTEKIRLDDTIEVK